MLLDVIRQYGLPMPVRNYVVKVEGVPVAELDLAYPDNVVDLEAQGSKWHSTRRQVKRDVERRAILEALGWDVQLFDWDLVVHWPDQAAAQIEAALCGSTAAIRR
jgi:very-short-patch-repair endonuclease